MKLIIIIIIVVAKRDVESATQLFSDIGMNFGTSQRLLGGHNDRFSRGAGDLRAQEGQPIGPMSPQVCPSRRCAAPKRICGPYEVVTMGVELPSAVGTRL